MTKPSKSHKVPGVTVYQRRQKWAYLISGETNLISGKPERIYQGGFETEDDAWAAALAKKSEIDRGRVVKPSARTVKKFLTEWLASIRHSVKPSTYANYELNCNAYVLPAIGARKLQDVSVPVLNALYVQFLESGRIRPDSNARMFAYWDANRDKRDGMGPGPSELSKECGTSYHAARKAVPRYQHGRVPKTYSAGLAPKSVRNIHNMLHEALKDAVAWNYLTFNPAEHASLPRKRRGVQPTPAPWTVEELAAWLRVALTDRFAGMWVLAATTGMRRSELAGIRRVSLDLEAGTLAVADTRVVVDGKVTDEDGKTDSGVRTIALDSFTIAMLQKHVAMLDDERNLFGAAYPRHGALFVWPDGSRPHPDTITSLFNRLVDIAGVRHIRLHDIRHTYITFGLDSEVDPKKLSDRAGHANMNVTFTIYGHRSTGQDREVAEHLGRLIEAAVQAEQEPAGETVS